MALAVASPQTICAAETVSMEVEVNGKEAKTFECFPDLPPECQVMIIKQAVYDDCYEEGHANRLALVCTDWYKIIKTDRKFKLSLYPYPHNLEQSCLLNIFMNGEIVYRPNPDSNKGMIRFKISDLANPLEGTIDLSQCGGALKDLSIINTGYPRGQIGEKPNKLEIWLAPLFLFKKELERTAGYSNDNFSKWKPNTPFGILWAWGNWDNLKLWDERLRNAEFDEINSNESRKIDIHTWGSAAFRSDAHIKIINYGQLLSANVFVYF